jgi:hypothetical protein
MKASPAPAFEKTKPGGANFKYTEVMLRLWEQ